MLQTALVSHPCYPCARHAGGVPAGTRYASPSAQRLQQRPQYPVRALGGRRRQQPATATKVRRSAQAAPYSEQAPVKAIWTST